ncbi:uncharacterized protein LOC123321564 isoform X2 [Coccinella septempunctata]|uniref:uncharacterized protein LOC123321564 isoform X2 n=1 Tax=Coccinella septempunctata TaxID=41139 RepID=UPI001D05CC52|nr:uncharacterized protein LOC123321564 isoform X2 [Coccinella septempunctata]
MLTGVLMNLTSYAIQSRQINQGYPNQPITTSNYPGAYNHLHRIQGTREGGNTPVYAGHYNYFQKYQNRPLIQNPASTYGKPYPEVGYGLLRPRPGYPVPQIGYPDQNGKPWTSFLPSRESFMEALDSIARNDELRCVPRILCEVTSGTLSARQSGLRLPFNVDMDSIVGLLSGFNGVELNPLLSFGKAALLGYSSKGNAGSCMYAYPECPRDPEKLVDYLNNYNGGFFRFFSGLNPQHQQNQFYGQLPAHLQQRPSFPANFLPAINNYGSHVPHRVYNYKANRAEKRILTKPTDFDYASNRFPDVRQQRGIKFPDAFGNELYPSSNFHDAGPLRTLKFPISDEDAREGPLRHPKRLAGFHETSYQRPSPAHRPAPMIFPDRTGTGELKFNPEELADYFDGPTSFQNNNLISFERETNDFPSYFSHYGPYGSGADYTGSNRLNDRFFPA